MQRHQHITVTRAAAAALIEMIVKTAPTKMIFRNNFNYENNFEAFNCFRVKIIFQLI